VKGPAEQIKDKIQANRAKETIANLTNMMYDSEKLIKEIRGLGVNC